MNPLNYGKSFLTGKSPGNEVRFWVESMTRIIDENSGKTMNTNRQKKIYQTDTGQVAFPDLSKHYERHVDRISLAFVAFNVTHFADFVIEEEIPIGENGNKGKEICKVRHYSRSLSLKAENRLYVIKS